MANDEQDIRTLNTKLVDFIVHPSQSPHLKIFQQLIVDILLLCRNQEELSASSVRSALATALFMIQSKGSAVCMLDQVETFIKKIN